VPDESTTDVPENHRPRDRAGQIDPTAFVASTAIVRGDVAIGADSSVWFGAVIRGDTEAIRVGRRTNIQDGSILHADPGFPCVIGDGVTIGHGAVVHGAAVEDGALIGIRAVVLNGCRVGAGGVVAAGAVLAEGTEVPPGGVAMGVPAKLRRQVEPDDVVRSARAADHYVELARAYRAAGD
jgi:carbonic anhydrase/acetyltransferase-like protein (isoleucine patch superfamily)